MSHSTNNNTLLKNLLPAYFFDFNNNNKIDPNNKNAFLQNFEEVFNLTEENAPFIYSLKKNVPSPIFNYDPANRPEGTSKFVHLVLSAVTVISISLFILAGLVEKAVRFTVEMIKKGIDRVLTKEQQDNIKQKADSIVVRAKNAGKDFFERHFAPFFK